MAEQITPPFDWHKHLKVHPAADLFPELSNGELEELAADIRQQGLRVPIVLFGGELLDGRNRLNAAQKEGLLSMREGGLSIKWPDGHIEILRREEVRGDPYGIVLALNVRRRHLTADQKRELIGKVLKASPHLSNRQVGKAVGADKNTIARAREELEATGAIHQLEKTIGADGKARTTKPAKAVKHAVSRQDPKPATENQADPTTAQLTSMFRRLAAFTQIEFVISLLKLMERPTLNEFTTRFKIFTGKAS